MKQIFFLFLFAGVFSFGMNAQTCAGAAKMDKKSCAASCAAKTAMAAAEAATADASIEARTSDAGTVTYVRKDVCAVSGKVSYVDVEYCSTSKAFKTVAAKADAKSCQPKACDPAACKKGKKDAKADAKATKV